MSIAPPIRQNSAGRIEWEAQELLTLDNYLIHELDRTTLHTVRGDSMRDAIIVDGVARAAKEGGAYHRAGCSSGTHATRKMATARRVLASS